MTAPESRPANGAAPAARVRPGLAALAFVADAALIVLFSALGRRSHAREETLLGLFETAWPFLAGLAIAWLAMRVWRRPIALLSAGLPVWVGTVGIGLLLRWLTGGGVALPFVLVATGALGVFLLGWRGIAALALRLRRRG